MKNKITIAKIFKHFKLVTKHRFIVFKLSCKLGIPWRGFIHDLSKYTPTEFWESVRYYDGSHSPITEAKKNKGFSEAWLHHKGRNKHHTEYWVDESAPNSTPLPPFKYVAEMLCDKTSAGIVYSGKNYAKDEQLNYYLKERTKIQINENLDKLFIDFFTKMSKEGIDKVFKRDYVLNLYNTYYNQEEKNSTKKDYI